MHDRRTIKCCIVLVLSVIVWLHVHLVYFCPDQRCSSSPDTVSALPAADTNRYHVTSAVTWDELADALYDDAARVSCPRDYDDKFTGSLRGSFLLPNFTTESIPAGYRFDPDDARDVLVFLHIQKTGGTTFGRHLVSNLDLATRCKCRQHRKKCDCRNASNKIWMVNRHSTGWRCGLHADWTELTQCVDTMLDKIEESHRERR